MNEILLDIDKFLATTLTVKSLLGIGAGGIVIAGIGATSKVGLIRALHVGFKSKFLSPLSVRSVRILDIVNLKQILSSLSAGEYISVLGDKGFGKTLLINTALENQCGVLNVSVSMRD